MKAIKLIPAAVLFVLGGASLDQGAQAAPLGSFDDGLSISGSNVGPAPGAPVNNAGGMLFGPATPGATMPLPQPAQVPPLALDTSYAAQKAAEQKAADAELPEPHGVALLLAGLALMGLAARKARIQRR